MGICSSVKPRPNNTHNTYATAPTLIHSETMQIPKAIRNQISDRTEYDGIILLILDVNKFYTLGNHIGNGSYGLVREGKSI
jgi:hypothetical protein